MPDVVQNVVINFTTNDSELVASEDRLEQLGQIDKQTANAFKTTNAELAKRVALLKQDVQETAKGQAIHARLLASIKDLNGQAKSAVQNLLKMSAREVAAGFDNAAVAVDDYIAALKKADETTEQTENSTESLRQRLKTLTQAIAESKLAGKDQTQQFKEMVREAGNIKDAIGDAAAEIKNAGSDTRGIDNVLGSVSALAGGFSLVQGTAALFGDESEELNETLLKVNATMAIASGAQQVLNAVQKEGAITKLADTVATTAMTAAQTLYNYVVGASTIALKAFRIALLATGVGVFIVLIAALYEAFQTTEENLDKVNDQLERNKALLDADTESIKRRTDLELARAEALGKAETDLTKIRGRGLQEQRARLFQTQKDLTAQADELDRSTESWTLLNNQIAKNKDELDKIDADIVLEGIKLQGQLADEQKKSAEERKKLQEEAAARARELRLQELNDQLAGIELRRLAAEQAGEDTLKFDMAIIAKRAQIELEGEKLTENQKKLIREQTAAEAIKLAADTAKKGSDAALQALISQNNAVLTQLNLNATERLGLIEDNLITAAQLEINAAEGNAVKVKEIEAKRDADIKAARLKSITDTLNYELALRDAESGQGNRALQQLAANEDAALEVRKGAIDDLLEYELVTGDKKLAALNKQLGAGLISYEDYNLQYEKITDDQLKAVEDAEAKKQDLTKKTAEEQKKQVIATINSIVQVAGQVADILSSLGQLQAEKDKQRFDKRRQEIADLMEAGAITEKEEKQRIKQLEAEERKARYQQAQRDKQAAVFKAVLAIPQAVLNGLSQSGGNPIVAAIYGALAAAQAAIIAARPIPKFRKGKKDSYTGLGEVGEAGTELVEKDGRMYVVDRPQVIWLNPKDKVYNPQETRQMMYSPAATSVNGSIKFDYKRMGEEVGRNIPQTGFNMDKDGFSEWIKEGELFTKYLNGRRGR